MTDFTGRLRVALQLLDENPESWGSVLNQSVFQLLEDSISGTVNVDVTSANQTLTTTDGGTDTARYAVLTIIGTPGVARNVIVPEGTDGGGTAAIVATSKLYFVIDGTTGGFQMSVKTLSGTGVDIPIGKSAWVFSDGTNVVSAAHSITAGSSDTAALATDSNALGTFAAALYARLALQNTWAKAQVSARVALTSLPVVLVDASASNRFFLEALESFTLANPTSPVDGESISVIIKQGAGGPYTITFGTAYAFQSAVHPTLTPVVGAYDLFSAEYNGSGGQNEWHGALIKDMRNA